MLKGSTQFIIGPVYLYGKDEDEILENAKREIEIYNGNVDAILIKPCSLEGIESVLFYLNGLRLSSEIDIPYGINYAFSLDMAENCRESFELAKQYGASFVVVDSIAGYSYSIKNESFIRKMRNATSRIPYEEKATLTGNGELKKEEVEGLLEQEQLRLHQIYVEELNEHNRRIEEICAEMRKSDEERDKELKEEIEKQRKDNGIFVIGTIRDIGFFAIPGHTLSQDLEQARSRCDAILLNSGSLHWIKYDLGNVRKILGSAFPIIIDSTKLTVEKSLKLFKPISGKDDDQEILGANGMIARCIREPISQVGVLEEEKVQDLKARVLKMSQQRK